MEACTNRLEELTKDAPQKPESWAMNTKLRSDVRKKYGDKEHDNDKGCEKLSAAEEQCTVCHRFQAFFKDGLRQVFTAALSKADSNHLWG